MAYQPLDVINLGIFLVLWFAWSSFLVSLRGRKATCYDCMPEGDSSSCPYKINAVSIV